MFVIAIYYLLMLTAKIPHNINSVVWEPSPMLSRFRKPFLPAFCSFYKQLHLKCDDSFEVFGFWFSMMNLSEPMLKGKFLLLLIWANWSSAKNLQNIWFPLLRVMGFGLLLKSNPSKICFCIPSTLPSIMLSNAIKDLRPIKMRKDKLGCLDLNAIWWDSSYLHRKFHCLISMERNFWKFWRSMFEQKRIGFLRFQATVSIFVHSIFL